MTVYTTKPVRYYNRTNIFKNVSTSGRSTGIRSVLKGKTKHYNEKCKN